VPAARLGSGLQVDDVVEVTLFLGAGWRILAAHHAHEPHVVGAPAHHLQRLHQPGETIALDAHLFFDLGRRAHRALVDGGRPARVRCRAFALGRRRLHGRTFAFGRRRLRGRAFAFGRYRLRGRAVTAGRFACRFARRFARRFGRTFGR
jgi:hypothetical protein